VVARVLLGREHSQKDHERADHHASAPLACLAMDDDRWLDLLTLLLLVNRLIQVLVFFLSVEPGGLLQL